MTQAVRHRRGPLYRSSCRSSPPPERWLAELTSAGAHLVSLNPIRETLEDFFVQQVTSAEVLGTDRGLDAPGRGAA